MDDLVAEKDTQSLYQAQGRAKEIDSLLYWLNELESFTKEMKENG